MKIAWYIVPYKVKRDLGITYRYCAIDDYTERILADGGKWAETEVLGDQALVKVRASVDTLFFLATVYKSLSKSRVIVEFGAGIRLKPRYDKVTDTIVCDGEVQVSRSLEDVDYEVR